MFSRGAMVSGAAMLIGTVGGGLLGQLDLSLPFVARSGLLALAFVLALFGMRDLGFHARALTLETLRGELASVARAGLRYGWSQRSLRLLMLASAVQTGFLIWGFYAWQPYFQELLETDAVWFAGAVAAGVAASTMVGNAVVDHFARLCGRRTTLLLWAASLQTIAAIGVGLSPSFPSALICLLIVTATMGVVGPVRQAYIHKVVPGEQRATVVSFDSMVANVGGVGRAGGARLCREGERLRHRLHRRRRGHRARTPALLRHPQVERGRRPDRRQGRQRSSCAAQGLASIGGGRRQGVRRRQALADEAVTAEAVRGVEVARGGVRRLPRGAG